MVYRVFVEKKEAFASEARGLLSEATGLLGIKGLEAVRVINRYDAENIRPELFEYAKQVVFSEPQVDTVYDELDLGDAKVFAVEPLPGQYDQRSDSAAQCIQIIAQEERPTVKAAKVYALYGNLSDADVDAIKAYLINPVESREADLAIPETLQMEYEVPTEVAVLDGFTDLDLLLIKYICTII